MNDTNKDATRKVTVTCQFCLTRNRVDVRRLDARPKCGDCGKPILLDRPVKVSDDDLGQLVRDAEVPVMVDFHADWCGPCKIMAPVLDDIAQSNLGELVVAKLDTDRNPKSTQQYDIRSIPTLILFIDGQEAARKIGAVPLKDLEALLTSAIG